MEDRSSDDIELKGIKMIEDSRSFSSHSSAKSRNKNGDNSSESANAPSAFTNQSFVEDNDDNDNVVKKIGNGFDYGQHDQLDHSFDVQDKETLDGFPVITTSEDIKMSRNLEAGHGFTLDDISQSTKSSSSNFINNLSCVVALKHVFGSAAKLLKKHSKLIKNFVYALLVFAYFVYFGYALSYQFGEEQSIRLLFCTLAAVAMIMIWYIKKHYGDWIYEHVITPPVEFIENHWMPFKIGFIAVVSILLVLFIILAVAIPHPSNLISLSGTAIYIFLIYVFSSNRSKIYWRTVLWGLGLQFVFALLVLRTVAGYEAFKWLGERIQEFLSYSDAGAIFIFGDSYEDHYFAFKVLPVVIYFSSCISVLYYLGAMQALILKIAWIMQRTMATTAAESVNAAGNIFIGQTEAPLLIRPFLEKMTKSEIHAVMVGGYATIAGSVMATYIIIGVPANHLISASIMAAPCALALSKLSYPETERSETTADNIEELSISTENNVVEAAANGASTAIALAANIAANLIAFISILAFINATLTWFGHRAGLYNPDLTFEFICSYVLWPFAFVMGVSTQDCRKVAELIGVKTFINEFVAFTELGKIIENSNIFNGYVAEYGDNSYTSSGDDIILTYTNQTLIGGVLEEKSITISTYALCGFANVSSIGCVIGGLTAISPKRQKDVAALAVRAMIVGNIVSLMNACTAGLLYEPSEATANSTMLWGNSMLSRSY